MVYNAGGGGWGKFGFETTSTAFPEGTYTYKMVIEAVTINGETATTHKTFSPIDYYNDPKNVNSGEDYSKVFKTPLNIYGFYYGDSTSSGTTYNMVATKRYSDAEQVKLQASESNPIDFAGVRSLFAMHSDAPAKGSEFKVQLMELYYKPADVTIKFANGGVSGTTLPESVTVNSFDAVDTTLYRATNTADKLFKGWVDEDGNRVTNKYYPTKDVTLTAVWEDAWSDEFGYLVAAYDFDNIAAGTNVKDSTGKLSANVYGAQPSAEVLTAIHKDFPTEMFIYAASANTHTINYDGNNGFINLNAVKSDQKWGRTHLVSNGVFPAGTYNLVKDVKLAEHDDTVTRISAGDANIYLVNPYASTHPAEAYKNHSPGNTVLSSMTVGTLSDQM